MEAGEQHCLSLQRCCLPCFWRQGLSLIWNWLITQDWLSTDGHLFSCLHFFREEMMRTIAQLFYVGSGWSYLCPHIDEATTYKLGYPSRRSSVHTIWNGLFIFFKPSYDVLCLKPVPYSIGPMKKAMENFWGPCFTLALIPNTSNKRTFIHRQTTHGKIRCPVNCKQIFPACNQKLNLN